MNSGDELDDDPPPVANAPYRFWGGAIDDLRATYDQRELLRSFVTRELRQRYKGSFLGWGWALIRPLMMLIVYGVAVGIFLGAGEAVPDFALYLYVGLVSWGFFASLVTGAINALPANAGLINKAAFPKELLMAAVVVVASIDLFIQAAVLIPAYLVVGDWPDPTDLWWLIPGYLVLTTLGLGLGMLLAAANVYLRDIGYFTEIALQVGFWAVPIVYSFAMVKAVLVSSPVALALYSANPAVPAVNSFRLALWPPGTHAAGQNELMSQSTTAVLLVLWLLGGLVILWLGQRFLARVSGNLAEEL